MTYDDTMTSTPSHTSLRRCPSMRLAWHAPNDPNVRMERIEHALVFQLEALIRLGCKWVQHATTIYYIYIYYIYMYQLCTLAQLMVQHGTTNVYLTMETLQCRLVDRMLGLPPGASAPRAESTSQLREPAESCEPRRRLL
jgi:hypothetical protein